LETAGLDTDAFIDRFRENTRLFYNRLTGETDTPKTV
jgi:hypothetical protein